MPVADIEGQVKLLTVKEKQALYEFLAQELEHTKRTSDASKGKRVFRAPVKRRLTLIFLTFAACTCVLCLVGGYFAFLDFFYWSEAHERMATHELALISIMGSLKLGDTQHKVGKIFEQRYVTGLRLHRDERDLWSIYGAYGSGGTDWILYIEFNDRQQVNALVMRTQEGPYRVSRAPHNKGKAVKYPFLLDVVN